MRLGDYTVLSLIGRGGMARVYEGFDDKLGRRAAIKVMEVQHDQGDELTQRFVREARAVANLDHPNIVGIYQFGEADNLYYMAMKYIEGHTLLSLLKRLRQKKEYLDPDLIIRITSEMASALDYAHSRGVIHRDIKPSNIMLTPDDHAILTDFGLTMQVGSESTLGTAFGTPRYIAPEQAISSQRSVPQSDIYSLGVVLYEMVVGQAPFDSDSPMSLALSHITNMPPLPQTIRADLAHPVQTVILKALEKRPENRWPTATAMADALRKAYAGIEPNVTLTQEMLEVEPETKLPTPSAASSADQTAIAPLSSLDISSPGRKLTLPKLPQLSRRLMVIPLVIVLLLAAGLIYLALRTDGASDMVDLQPPDPAPAQIRLIYSQNTFAVYNATGQTVSLEGVSFIRNDSASMPFRALEFGDRLHKALQGGQCLRLSVGSVDQTTFPFVCGPQTKLLGYSDPNFIFWAMRGETDSTSTFLVKRGDKTLQVCSMRLNTCEFSIS